MKSTYLVTCLCVSALTVVFLSRVVHSNLEACHMSVLPMYLRQLCATAITKTKDLQPSKSTIRDLGPPRRRPINPAIRFGKRSRKTTDYFTVKVFRIFNYLYSNMFDKK